VAIPCLVVVLPLLAFQGYAYLSFCVPNPTRPWCQYRLPIAYSYVQGEYWYVLTYTRLCRKTNRQEHRFLELLDSCPDPKSSYRLACPRHFDSRHLSILLLKHLATKYRRATGGTSRRHDSPLGSWLTYPNCFEGHLDRSGFLVVTR
jgi:hypothetical protein